MYEKSTEFLQCFFAPPSIELLNLWNDFRKVVKFIDENQTWLRPLMDRVASNKKAEEKKTTLWYDTHILL